jgi:hypothetical protein
MQSLRWLLKRDSDRYGIDLTGTVEFQGENIPAVTGHRDHGNTACPGRRLQSLLPILRKTAARGDFTSRITPQESESGQRFYRPRLPDQGFRAIGSTNISLPPGGAARIQLRYIAAERTVDTGDKFAIVDRSDRGIGIWHMRDERKVRLRDSVIAVQQIRKGSEDVYDFTVLAPRSPGIYTINIGAVQYRLDVQGRRTRR